MDKKLRASSIRVIEFLNQVLEVNSFYNWSFVVDKLANEFDWSPKTCSNRIHELIQAGYLERTGTFEKPNPRKIGGQDLRKIRTISQLIPQNQSEIRN